MNPNPSLHRQGGATLVVGLIMLTVITLLVATSFSFSTTNLKAVGNMQFRESAKAAASVAIEQVMTSLLLAAPTTQDIPVDLNADATTDYTVHIVPTCITSFVVAASSGIGQQGSVELGSELGVGGSGSIGGYMTIWDLDATVTEVSSGASIRLHQGVRKLLSFNCT